MSKESINSPPRERVNTDSSVSDKSMQEKQLTDPQHQHSKPID